MADIEIQRIQNHGDKRRFLTFPWQVYKGDPLWVPPLLPERSRMIDPQQGLFFERGEADFFMAWKDGKVQGTICAAVDPPANRRRGTRECMFGFLETVQDYTVFQALVDRAADWGRKRGLKTLYGPWNLDYEDGYGVLISGWDRPPALMCGHSPPYYRGFMERYGFVPARPPNVALGLDLRDGEPFQRAFRVADKLKERKNFRIREADFEHWDDEIDRVLLLLNNALVHLEDHIGWRRDTLASTLEPFKQIADPELILFAEHEGQTVGFLPALPDLNQVLIHANGLRYPWDYVKLWWHMTFHPPRNMTVKSMLVLPEYWKTGVAVLLLAELAQRIMDRGCPWVDLSVTSQDNPNSMLIAENHGAKVYKRWQVYQYPLEGS